MKIPFTVDEFLEVFKLYNQAVYPMQIIAYIIGILLVVLAIREKKYSSKIISAGMAFLWVWNGLMYHILSFSSINKLAYLFGGLFIVQGLLFFVSGVLRDSITFHFKMNLSGVVGSLFILYAMFIYPVLGYLFGHGYPQSPMFGIAPCPTTIFTFGMLLWTMKLPKKMLWIPLIWSLIGFSAALSLGIKEDVGLLIAGMVGVIITLRPKKPMPIEKNRCEVCKCP